MIAPAEQPGAGTGAGALASLAGAGQAAERAFGAFQHC
jgi:hypothetical protein